MSITKGTQTFVMGKSVGETLFASTAAASDISPSPTKSTAYATTQQGQSASNSMMAPIALVGESAKANTAYMGCAALSQSTSFSTQS